MVNMADDLQRVLIFVAGVNLQNFLPDDVDRKFTDLLFQQKLN